MRALLLRRTAFLAVLATGLGLTASGINGLSGMDTSLKLAAATHEPRTVPVGDPWGVPVGDRWGGCDRHREPPPHRI
jgi:hypothetical protein